MTILPPITLVDDDAASRAILEKAVMNMPQAVQVRVCASVDVADETDQDLWIVLGETTAQKFEMLSESQIFTKPVRMGVVFDRIEHLVNRIRQDKAPAYLTIGPWALDMVHSCLRRNDEQDAQETRLTDKERDILHVLHQNAGKSVSRVTLLQEVWGYVDGVETHTLETHIYRLRQKIEPDPSIARLLMTEAGGYRLAH